MAWFLPLCSPSWYGSPIRFSSLFSFPGEQIFFPRSIEREAGYRPRGRSASDGQAGQPRSTYHDHGSSSRLASNAAPAGKGVTVTTHTTSYIELQEASGRGRTQVWEMVTVPEAVASPDGDRQEIAPFEYVPSKTVQVKATAPPRPPRRELNPMLMHYVRLSESPHFVNLTDIPCVVPDIPHQSVCSYASNQELNTDHCLQTSTNDLPTQKGVRTVTFDLLVRCSSLFLLSCFCCHLR